MDFLLAMLILLLFAKIFGDAMHRLGFSSLIGEVFAGVLLGPALLGLVPSSDALYGIAMLGLVLLMLVAGMNSRFDLFTKIKFKAFVIAIFGMSVSFLFAFVVSYSMGFELLPSLFVAAALSNTATEITARFTTGHHLSQVIVSAALVDDIIAVYILGILSASTVIGTLNIEVLILATISIIAFFLIIGYLSHLLIIKHDMIRRLWKYEARGIPLLFVVSLALALAVIAQNIGLHAIIGAYMAGLFIGRMRERPMAMLQGRIHYNKIMNDISNNLQTILTPIFFAYVGLKFAPNWGGMNLLMIAVLLIAAFAGKIIGCGGGAAVMVLNSRDSITVGTAMSARGSLELSMLHFGFISLGAYGFTSELFATMVIITLATTIFTPILFKYVSKT